MANEPRNKAGQTYDEWVEAQRKSQQDQFFGTGLEPWDLVVGMDRAKGIPGVKFSSMGIIVGRVTRPFVPTVTSYSQQAANQYGVTFQGVSYGTKTFQIPITVKAKNKEELNRTLRILASVVITPGQTKETSIVFGEEPDIVYYGHFETISDPTPLTETTWDSSVTLSFVASDPRGFYNSDNVEVDLSDGEVTIIPQGTAAADPIITVEPKNGAAPLVKFGYTINDEHVVVGSSVNTSLKFDEKPAVFIDTMNDMNNWELVVPSESFPNNVLSFDLARDDILTDGYIGATPGYPGVVNNRIEGSNARNLWTTTPEKYKQEQTIGPVAISKTNFSSSIGAGNNWETAFRVHNIKEYSRSLQGLEMYLLDSNGKRRARFGIRSDDSGTRPYSWIRFGQDYDEETKAVATGLGYAQDYGLKSDYVDKKDVSVQVPDGKTVTIQQPYTTSKITKAYTYVSITSTTKITETWNTVETTTYNPTTKKYTTKITSSPLNSVYDKNFNGTNQFTNYILPSKYNDFRPLTKWDDYLKLQPGIIQYWKKGEQKRQNDYGNAPLIPNQYYENNTTPGKVPLKNYTDITITEVYTDKIDRTTTQTIKMHYTNGNGERTTMDGKNFISNFGYLNTINFSWAQASANNAIPTTTQPELIDYPDKGEAGTYSDVLLLVIIGRDEKGFYWEVQELNPDGTAKGTALIPKTYDKRKDLHSSYDFTLDKLAIHMFKKNIPEDNNIYNPNNEDGPKPGEGPDDFPNYVPAKKYADNYLSVIDVRVYKLLSAPNYIDLINLKPGQKAQFDTSSNIFTIDGKKRNDIVNVDSTWPQLQGGVPTTITFLPAPNNNYIVKMAYRPTVL